MLFTWRTLCGGSGNLYDYVVDDIKVLFIIKSIKREVNTRPTYDCRCDERLEPKG
jgi:hypothetical protein